jgi:hypothetical protein
MGCKDHLEERGNESGLLDRMTKDGPRYAFVSKTDNQYFSTRTSSLTGVAKSQVQCPKLSVTEIVSRFHNKQESLIRVEKVFWILTSGRDRGWYWCQ